MKQLVIAGWILIAAVGSALAQDKVARDRQSVPAGSNGDVIVQFRTAPTDHHQKILNGGGKLKADLGGIIRGAVYSLPASAIADLAADPGIVASRTPYCGEAQYAELPQTAVEPPTALVPLSATPSSLESPLPARTDGGRRATFDEGIRSPMEIEETVHPDQVLRIELKAIL